MPMVKRKDLTGPSPGHRHLPPGRVGDSKVMQGREWRQPTLRVVKGRRERSRRRESVDINALVVLLDPKPKNE